MYKQEKCGVNGKHLLSADQTTQRLSMLVLLIKADDFIYIVHYIYFNEMQVVVYRN